MTRRSGLRAAVLVCALAVPAAAFAERDEPKPPPAEPSPAPRLVPTGSVTIETTTVSVGLGVSWGQGILTFRNQNHPFKVRGIKLVGVGGSSVKAEGTVFNLERREDFAGRWAQVSGLAVLGRASSGSITLGNGDLIMTLSAKQKGAKLAAGGGTVKIEFTDPAEEAPAEPE